MARSAGTRPKGSGIPAKGKGWGGPAKGASASRIKPGDPDGIQALANDPDIKARNEARAEQMRDVLYGIALDGENEHARISAATAFLNRVEGMPKQATDVTSGGEKVATFNIITGVPRADAD